LLIGRFQILVPDRRKLSRFSFVASLLIFPRKTIIFTKMILNASFNVSLQVLHD
jgi:hypothetical protein